MKFADLHLHTIFSDGTYTPETLVSEARRCGLSCICPVDHDTVSGVEHVLRAASAVGIEVLPGIELTAEYEGLEIHILGYLIDYKSKALNEKLELLRQNRVERIYRITDKLKDIGLSLDPESVFAMSKAGTVGRLHVARAMVAAGLVNCTYEAFAKYIGDKGPAYVLGFKLSPPQAISLIKSNGGIPVLAHPHSLNNDSLIAKFTDFGLMGLEVYYPEHTRSMISAYAKLARKYNLLMTGGSDCHGEAKPEVKMGSLKIPYELVEKLKTAQQDVR